LRSVDPYYEQWLVGVNCSPAALADQRPPVPPTPTHLPPFLAALQVCAALAQVAKHSVDLAEVVVEAELFPKCLTCLKYPDDAVRKAAATLCREVGRHC
jgi:hypothetical protein